MPADPFFDIFTPDLLNTLFLAYRRAELADREEWLTGELDRRGLGQYRKRLGEVFATVLGAGYAVLDGYLGGAMNSQELWAEHDAEIRRWSPWLDQDNCDWACHQSRYYAWHDGLVRR